MERELSYWLALAHSPKVTTRRKNDLIVQLFNEGKTIIDFFHSDKAAWANKYNLSAQELAIFSKSLEELPNYAFLVEDILEQGYSIIPITSKDYSPILKKNLGKQAPTLIYTKGNMQIMQEKSIAIVGSRKANDVSLEFTDKIAKSASNHSKVVVSGFARGVDKQALDSALKYKGQSIIVLPQGIMTFNSGFKKYYKEIINGDVLVLSSFYPKAQWSVELAMARNAIIYGLASEIYVAESDEKGGTWSGVIDGLKRGSIIFVRNADAKERNANNLLISKGAVSVNFEGYKMTDSLTSLVSEAAVEYKSDKTASKILKLLENGTYDSKLIITKLNIDWSTKKVTDFLKKQTAVEVIKGKPLKFTIKNKSLTLF